MTHDIWKCDVGCVFQIYSFVHFIVTFYMYGDFVQIFLHRCLICSDSWVFWLEI